MNLRFECRIASGWKKKNSGFHTGAKSRCDKCGKAKVSKPVGPPNTRLNGDPL